MLNETVEQNKVKYVNQKVDSDSKINKISAEACMYVLHAYIRGYRQSILLTLGGVSLS